jgi:hypothetical protein
MEIARRVSDACLFFSVHFFDDGLFLLGAAGFFFFDAAFFLGALGADAVFFLGALGADAVFFFFDAAAFL